MELKEGKMGDDTLRVLARGGILVLDADHAAASRGQRSYVGRAALRAWKLDDLPKEAPKHVHTNEFLESGQTKIPHCAYPRTASPTVVSNSSYYRKLVKKGALWPFDEATALVCGVRFDPTFGGDYPELTKTAARKEVRGKDGDS